MVFMKKGLKIIGCVLGIVIILGLIFFVIDYTRVKNGKNPIFCIRNLAGIYMDGGTIEYFGLGYKVIDFHTLAGYDDIKIGSWFMDYNDFEHEIKEYEEKNELKTSNNFEIIFYDRQPIESYKTYTVLGKDETDKYDYTIYGYNGKVNIKINEEEYSLREALIDNKITMEEIIAKADKDVEEKNINRNEYQEGGSTRAKIYQYDNYTIIKFCKVDGNSDVYIGNRTMTIEDVL